MRKHILTTIALVPLLFTLSHAEQNWTAPPQYYGVWSDDAGKGSYLGVDIADITTDRLGALKLKEEQGVEVTMVDQDAPAGKAGIKEHDVILSLNGTAVESKSQLQRMIHETPPGRLITLGLSRDGQPLTVKVQLADRHNEVSRWMSKDKGKDFDIHVEIPPIPNIPPIPEIEMPNIGVVYVQSSMRSGLMVENLTPQLGEFFGAKNGTGVLVRSVERGSRGEKAGLRAGDVITRVGDQPVHDTSDFAHALRAHGGGSVTVAVIRDRKEQTLTITLPERKDSGDIFIEEDSMEAPYADATAREKLMSTLQYEIAKMQPQMELAKQENAKASEQLRKALCTQQKELKQSLEQKLTPKVQDQRVNQLELQKAVEQLRHQLKGDGLDI